MEICASSTISQRLAEAFQTNTEAIALVPEYFKEFTSVFSKQTFDVLLEPNKWDHAMELIPRSKLSVSGQPAVGINQTRVIGYQ